MKRRLAFLLVLLMSLMTATALEEVPPLSSDLFVCAKQAVIYLDSGEYERLVTLLPFEYVSPSAKEWQNFAEGNFDSLGNGVQLEYAMAYWTGANWRLAVPVLVPNDEEDVETLVLTTEDGLSFTGYGYTIWSVVEEELEKAEYILGNKEFVRTAPQIIAD